MNVIKFLKSLLPNFAKSTVLEDIRTTKMILTTVTIPSYNEAKRLFGNRKMKNAKLAQDWDMYRRMVKGSNGPNFIIAFENSFKNILTTLDLVDTLVEKDYNEDIEGAGITYYKAAVLQMIESIGFAVDYANKYLNYIYILEWHELFDDSGVHKDDEGGVTVVDELNATITPAEQRFLNDRFQDFCTVMDTLVKPTEKIRSDFEEIPDINVTEAGDKAVQNTVGVTRLDPFRHGFVPIAMNPIYHIRMHIADYQHHRYERNKAEKDMLELRKLKLEKMLQGKRDAAIEKQIEYTQKRIDDLDAKIRKVEGEHG